MQPKLPLITFLGREAIEVFEITGPTLIISIRDSGKATEPAKLPQSPKIRHVLRLAFDDIDLTWPQSQTWVHFTPAMANEIWRFLAKHLEPDIEHLLINCEAGISRSAGVARAIAQVLHQNPLAYSDGFKRRGIPNQYVYRLLMEELRDHPEMVGLLAKRRKMVMK